MAGGGTNPTPLKFNGEGQPLLNCRCCPLASSRHQRILSRRCSRPRVELSSRLPLLADGLASGNLWTVAVGVLLLFLFLLLLLLLLLLLSQNDGETERGETTGGGGAALHTAVRAVAAAVDVEVEAAWDNEDSTCDPDGACSLPRCWCCCWLSRHGVMDDAECDCESAAADGAHCPLPSLPAAPAAPAAAADGDDDDVVW